MVSLLGPYQVWRPHVQEAERLLPQSARESGV